MQDNKPQPVNLNKELASELKDLESDCTEALIALTVANNLGLIQAAILANGSLVRLHVRVKDGIEKRDFPAVNLVEAVVAAGKEVHTQLMTLFATTANQGELQNYVTGLRQRQAIRESGKKLIVLPGEN